MPIDLDADHRVHTAFSTGTASVAEMVTAAETAQMRRLIVADSADSGADWIPAYLAAVRRAAARTTISVHAGLTVPIVDTTGRLDLPSGLAGVDFIVLTTDRLPLPPARRRVGDLDTGAPATVDGHLDPAEMLAEAMCRALPRAAVWGQPILADPFAPLRALGLSEAGLRPDLLHALAHACRLAGAGVEVNERLRSPSATVAVALATVGVPLLAASGARRRSDVGPGEYVRAVAAATTPYDYAPI